MAYITTCGSINLPQFVCVTTYLQNKLNVYLKKNDYNFGTIFSLVFDKDKKFNFLKIHYFTFPLIA